jgi:formylglycine-generating enzyme required for sulfatase activity
MLLSRAPLLAILLGLVAGLLLLSPKSGRSARDEYSPDERVAKVKKAADIDLVPIPGQKEKEFFFMGAENDDKDAEDNEKPRHKVRISKPFYLGETKVTVRQFKLFADATGYKTEGEKAGDAATWKNPQIDQADDHPVIYVSWNDAKAYCDWLDGLLGGKGKVRLPREAEWEYSCRANTTTRFSFGDDATKLGDYAWFDDKSGGKTSTHPVRQKKPNDFKLYDMHGNAWEWCWDGERKYANDDGVLTDPEGPTTAVSLRVIRGGAFIRNAQRCRSSAHAYYPPAVGSVALGFRVFVSR